MPPLNPHLPKEFVPGKRLSEEHLKKMNLNPDGFLWDGEERLFIDVIKNHELAFAWDGSERGHFREDYFDPVRIPVLAHTANARIEISNPNQTNLEITNYLCFDSAPAHC
jgi:hypothetical protein